MRVRRGLLSVGKHTTLGRPVRGAEEKVERIMNILQHESLGGYQWREYWQMFKRYGRGEPDFYGRRLMDLELQKKARYVARVCNHARTSKSLPSGRQWGHLRSAMLSIFQPL